MVLLFYGSFTKVLSDIKIDRIEFQASTAYFIDVLKNWCPLNRICLAELSDKEGNVCIIPV